MRMSMQQFRFVASAACFYFPIMVVPAFLTLATHFIQTDTRFIIATIVLDRNVRASVLQRDECCISIRRFESDRFIVPRTDPCVRTRVLLDEPGLFAFARRQSHSRVCSAALLTNDVRFMRNGNNVNTLYHSSKWTNGRVPFLSSDRRPVA